MDYATMVMIGFGFEKNEKKKIGNLCAEKILIFFILEVFLTFINLVSFALQEKKLIYFKINTAIFQIYRSFSKKIF